MTASVVGLRHRRASSSTVPLTTGLTHCPCRGPDTIVHLYVSAYGVGSKRNRYADAVAANT